jgi:hypothetical protein
LIELDDVSANGIFASLLQHLNSIGISEEYLGNYLVSVTCDGAAVMMGACGGVMLLNDSLLLLCGTVPTIG